MGDMPARWGVEPIPLLRASPCLLREGCRIVAIFIAKALSLMRVLQR